MSSANTPGTRASCTMDVSLPCLRGKASTGCSPFFFQSSRPSPCREQRDFSLLLEMTRGRMTSRPSSLSTRPFLPVNTTFPPCHLDLPHCHLDRKGEISNRPESIPRRERRDFSLRFEMTVGAASRPSPCREQRDFPLSLEMTRGRMTLRPSSLPTRPSSLPTRPSSLSTRPSSLPTRPSSLSTRPFLIVIPTFLPVISAFLTVISTVRERSQSGLKASPAEKDKISRFASK